MKRTELLAYIAVFAGVMARRQTGAHRERPWDPSGMHLYHLCPLGRAHWTECVAGDPPKGTRVSR